MGSRNIDSLYLFELMVDSVHINNLKCLPIKDPSAELCVRFQFLSIQELDICRAEKCPLVSQDIPFKSGKSCLFSLQSPHTVCKACVNIFLIQKRPSCPSEEPGFVGQACIPLPEYFLDLFKNVKCPSSKQLKTTAILKQCQGMEVGCAKVFIRLSSFGGSIVTQFHDNETEKESFCLKSLPPQGVPNCSDTNLRTPCTKNHSSNSCSYRGDAQLSGSEGVCNQRSSGMMSGDACKGCCGHQMGTCSSETGGEGDSEDESEFSVIKAEVNGHALKIKIPKRQKKEEDSCPPVEMLC